MATLHKTWYRCDACGKEKDDTSVVHNRFEINRAHMSAQVSEVCDDCSWSIKEAIRETLDRLAAKK